MNMIIRGLNTNYIYTGESGPTVLFLHGWGAPISLYQGIFDLLAGKGYRVAAFDMPGVGGTEEPAAPLTVEDYVAFTLEFCQKAEIGRAIVMCHSHGGRIALSLLSDPDCPVDIKKAVLIDATGAPLKKSPSSSLKLYGYKCVKILGTSRFTSPLFGGIYKKARDRRSSADYKAASPVMKKTLVNVLPADFTAAMPSIKAEVLLIWGEHDTATPLESARIMEKLIPGSGLAVIKASGHFPFVDNWPQFKAVLDAFL